VFLEHAPTTGQPKLCVFERLILSPRSSLVRFTEATSFELVVLNSPARLNVETLPFFLASTMAGD
jgi:hypothetical protein